MRPKAIVRRPTSNQTENVIEEGERSFDLEVEGGKDSGKKHTDRSRVFVAARPDWRN